MGHDLASDGAGSGQILVAFLELEKEIDGLLLEGIPFSGGHGARCQQCPNVLLPFRCREVVRSRARIPR